MFNPLEHPGLPTDRHGRHWPELDVGAAHVQAADPGTRERVAAMEALQAAAAGFDQRLTGRCPDTESRQAVARLGASATARRADLAALRWPAPPPSSTLFGGGGGLWSLVAHESTACTTYHTFLEQETDRRLRQLWELHLQMELAHLHTAGDLLRRYEDRDPADTTGEHPAAPDLPDALTGQQERIERQFQLTLAAAGEERHLAYGELAWLIAVHETIEEEIVHPLTHHLDPAAHLAEHLLDDERRISEAIEDTTRTDAAAGLGGTDGLAALHDLLTAHIRRETREEFPLLRAAVAAAELRELGDLVHAAAAQAATGSTARPAVPQAAQLVRDELRPTAQQLAA